MAAASGLAPVISVMNPSFAISRAASRRRLLGLERLPVRLPRPVVVLSGYRGPDFQAVILKERLRRCTDDDAGNWLAISYPLLGSMDAIVARVRAAVIARFGTAEVDVVGISMGGLVGMLASLPEKIPAAVAQSMRVVRVFTLATPHQGARMADKFAPDQASRCLRSQGAFVRDLDAAWRAHSAVRPVCYSRLADTWVGAQWSAPSGEQPIWTDGQWGIAHGTVTRDPRIVLDLALRLRGEEPVGQPSAAPTQ